MTEKSALDFFNALDKDLTKVKGLSNSSEEPRWWIGFGNYVLNRIMSGGYRRGIAQGRCHAITGPSGAGKSFILGNICKNAQQEGAFVVVLDSESALDDLYMNAIGVTTTREAGYFYKGVRTIPQVTKVVSEFIGNYRDTYSGSDNPPKVVIVIDSLDMLMTETEESNYDKGVVKGDQGQRNKQLKAMLRTFVHDIKDLDIALLAAGQTYKNQDILNGEGVWMVADAIKYSMSQILMVTKLKLKGKESGNYEGVRIRASGYKTRFTKPFQTVELEVPYDTGIDPASGLIEVAINLGVLEKRGSRVAFTGEKESFFAKDVHEYLDRILTEVEAADTGILNIGSEEDDDNEEQTSSKKRRIQAAGLDTE